MNPKDNNNISTAEKKNFRLHLLEIVLAVVGIIVAIIFSYDGPKKWINDEINSLLGSNLHINIPLWPLVILSIFLLVLLLIAINRRIRNTRYLEKTKYPTRQKKRISLFHPLIDKEEYNFWAQFVLSVFQEVNEREGYEVEFKPIDIYNNIDESIRVLKSHNWSETSGAIISSPNDVKLLDVLVDLVKENVKLVIHDFPIEETRFQNKFSTINMIRPAVVTIDNKKGGMLAAEILFEKLQEKRASKSYHILIMHGKNSHIHSQLRIQGFLERINELGEVTIQTLRDGHWSFDIAKQSFNRYISNGGQKRVDGIFACNDEMALGIKSAIENISTEAKKQKFKDTFIVGFDALPKMVEEIHKHGIIGGSIDAVVAKQAKETIANLINLIEGRGAKDQMVDPVEKK